MYYKVKVKRGWFSDARVVAEGRDEKALEKFIDDVFYEFYLDWHLKRKGHLFRFHYRFSWFYIESMQFGRQTIWIEESVPPAFDYEKKANSDGIIVHCKW